MSLLPIFFLLAVLTSATGAWGSTDLDPNDPNALREATRVLAEEVKLAARPYTYLVIDLVANTIFIKGRGVELHRIPLTSWKASHQGELAATFRLRERPPITRRKIDPTVSPEQDPISLADMPTTYALAFTPALTISIDSYDGHDLWRLLRSYIRYWWIESRAWWSATRAGNSTSVIPRLYLTVAVDHAQSLAWTVTDGMPVLVRRPVQ
jgi:hypothetical protein